MKNFEKKIIKDLVIAAQATVENDDTRMYLVGLAHWIQFHKTDEDFAKMALGEIVLGA